jgi:hypothetical protein
VTRRFVRPRHVSRFHRSCIACRVGACTRGEDGSARSDDEARGWRRELRTWTSPNEASTRLCINSKRGGTPLGSYYCPVREYSDFQCEANVADPDCLDLGVTRVRTIAADPKRDFTSITHRMGILLLVVAICAAWALPPPSRRAGRCASISASKIEGWRKTITGISEGVTCTLRKGRRAIRTNAYGA